ncbi:alpha/beta fold hydrolase [Streptomyces sp. VRA16 Mangrove soil]|uniref:alpha/beta fold hydrolase n=1 Tax=Streptomyces sp. VRA16 Mangrove soil TaxID=2817434 RepID=UPI001A9DDA29|nr:alpha/beta hydrolase [Streptomyces sp. VRA16 Mangrove soil]MBO1330002.1 alpha/beta hydrolase [Streptomyces sp. VRA16 Mangrove soil]
MNAMTTMNVTDPHTGLGPVRHVRTDVLDIAYHAVGPARGRPVLLLHGWPFSPVGSYAEVAPALARRGHRCYIPYLRGHGETRFLNANTVRSGQQAALGADLLAFMDALDIPRALFAGYDWGGRAGDVAAALWPERCTGLVSVNGYLIQNLATAQNPLAARQEEGYWYFFYFATERGRKGLQRNREDLARVVWHRNSPQWRFTEAEFAQTATLWSNPDYVDVVIHGYRHRLGLAPGDPAYDELERRLLEQPKITVPAVTLDGSDDGVLPPTDGSGYAPHFAGPWTHHIVPGAGHNLPQEQPAAFTAAVLEVAAMP